MATLETSLEANYDRRTSDGHWTDRRTKRLIGARATALPKKTVDSKAIYFETSARASQPIHKLPLLTPTKNYTSKSQTIPRKTLN